MKFKNSLIAILAIIIYLDLKVILINFFQLKLNLSFKFSITTSFIILFLGFALFFSNMLKKDLLNFKKKHLKEVFKLFIISYLAIFIINLVLFQVTKSIPTNEAQNRQLLLNLGPLSFLLIGFIGPFIEEICFRYNLRKLFKNNITFLLVSSLIFALLHINLSTPKELIFVIPYFIISIFIGLSYIKTKNVFVPILFHSMYNSVIILLLLQGGLV